MVVVMEVMEVMALQDTTVIAIEIETIPFQDEEREEFGKMPLIWETIKISKFGQMVEGISMFSRLLDANFDALHGSFASVLRLLEVFGEFFFVMKTFAAFGLFTRISNWMLGRKNIPKNRIEGKNSGSNNQLASKYPVVDISDISSFENRKGKFFPLAMMLLGVTCIGLPLFMNRVWKKLMQTTNSEQNADGHIENLWPEEKPGDPLNSEELILARAKRNFNGQEAEELTFRQNDIFLITSKPFPDWWEGEVNGRRGLFPRELIEIVDDPAAKPTV